MTDERDDRIEKALSCKCGHSDGTHVAGCPAVYREAVRTLLAESRNELLEQVEQALAVHLPIPTDEGHCVNCYCGHVSPNPISWREHISYVIRTFQSDPHWLERHDADWPDFETMCKVKADLEQLRLERDELQRLVADALNKSHAEYDAREREWQAKVGAAYQDAAHCLRHERNGIFLAPLHAEQAILARTPASAATALEAIVKERVDSAVKDANLRSRLMGIDDGENLTTNEIWDKWLELDCDKVLFTQWLSARRKEVKGSELYTQSDLDRARADAYRDSASECDKRDNFPQEIQRRILAKAAEADQASKKEG